MTKKVIKVGQLKASNEEAYDNFGSSVAITPDGLVAIVGASGEDKVDVDAGIVYTYKRDNIDDPWVEVSQLTASDGLDNDCFGISATITPDGLVAMVGAYTKDTAGTDAGKVYTYKRATVNDEWAEVNQLTSSDAEDDDCFGSSVSISGDGLVAMVGAYGEDTAGTDAGKVYTYRRATIGDPWTEVNQLTASDIKAHDCFGSSVAISGDGLIAMVGAYQKDTTAKSAGKVYTYKRDSIDDPWAEVNQLTASDAIAYDLFGYSLAMTGDGLLAMVGAYQKDTASNNSGKVYTYKRYSLDSEWIEIGQLFASDAEAADRFDSGCPSSSDDLVAIVSTLESNETCACKKSNIDDDWAKINIVRGSCDLGIAIAIASDTGVILLGSSFYGSITNAVYEYKRPIVLNKLLEVSKLTASDAEDKSLFGVSVALNENGLVAMVGAYTEDMTSDSAGKIYTYKRDSIDDDWIEVSQLTANDAEVDGLFGVSVAMSSDGLVAMVGAWVNDTVAAYAGKVYTYKRKSIDDDWMEVNQLTASDAKVGDLFGTSVAISGDGLIAMVGTQSENTAGNNAGKVYTYKRASIDDEWIEVGQLIASDAESGNRFGRSVTITPDGLIAMVGAYTEDTAGTDAGKVYTYKRDSIDDAWMEISQLTASDAEDDDQFGASVTITSDGLMAMVGANTEDTAGTDAGKVYVYKRATIDDAWTEVSQLTASDAEAGDHFGISVALASDGLAAMVGAWFNDTAGTDAGKVYTYKTNL